MATYQIDWYNDGWKTQDQGLSLENAYKIAKRYARVAKRFPEIKDIIVTHEQYGHVVLQFDAVTRELVYSDLD